MGRIVTFGDLVTFSVGTNMTRLSENVVDDAIYTLEDFDNDLSSFGKECICDNVPLAKGKGVVSTAGDVIISMTRNRACIVSQESSGKYLNSNFVKCEFDKEKLYPWYFCYLVNESPSISQQINKMQQGTISCINRLTISMIGSLIFELEGISKQRVVGDLYRNMLIQERLTLQQVANLKRYTLEVIKRVDNN